MFKLKHMSFLLFLTPESGQVTALEKCACVWQKVLEIHGNPFYILIGESREYINKHKMSNDIK